MFECCGGVPVSVPAFRHGSETLVQTPTNKLQKYEKKSKMCNKSFFVGCKTDVSIKINIIVEKKICKFGGVFQVLNDLFFFRKVFFGKKSCCSIFFYLLLQSINETEKTMLRIDRQLNIPRETDLGDTAKVRFVGFVLLYQQVA